LQRILHDVRLVVTLSRECFVHLNLLRILTEDTVTAFHIA